MSAPSEPIKLSRDTEVVQIPEGYRVRLARGTEVRVMQSLGDTYTVMTEYGTMVRIDGKDADSIGKTPTAAPAAATPAATTPGSADEIKDRVWSALRNVYDPEIPVNVVELGLVYKNEVTPLPDAGNYQVAVDMTLTAPGCGMGNVLKDDAERRLLLIPGVKQATVNVVFDPPWNHTMMSDAAKLELGLA